MAPRGGGESYGSTYVCMRVCSIVCTVTQCMYMGAERGVLDTPVRLRIPSSFLSSFFLFVIVWNSLYCTCTEMVLQARGTPTCSFCVSLFFYLPKSLLPSPWIGGYLLLRSLTAYPVTSSSAPQSSNGLIF